MTINYVYHCAGCGKEILADIPPKISVAYQSSCCAKKLVGTGKMKGTL